MKGLPQCESFIEVNLKGNRLECVPNLKEHKQFEHLEILSLSHNKIVTIEAEKLPYEIKVLDLSDNIFHDLGDLSKHHRLEKLDLLDSSMKFLDPSIESFVEAIFSDLCEMYNFFHSCTFLIPNGITCPTCSTS